MRSSPSLIGCRTERSPSRFLKSRTHQSASQVRFRCPPAPNPGRNERSSPLARRLHDVPAAVAAGTSCQTRRSSSNATPVTFHARPRGASWRRLVSGLGGHGIEAAPPLAVQAAPPVVAPPPIARWADSLRSPAGRFRVRPRSGARAGRGCTVNHARSPDHDRHGEIRPLLGRSEPAAIVPCLGSVTNRGRSTERSAILANRRTCGSRRGRSAQAKNRPAHSTVGSTEPEGRARSTPGRQSTAASSAPCLRYNHNCVSWEADARFIAASSTRGIQHGSESVR